MDLVLPRPAEPREAPPPASRYFTPIDRITLGYVLVATAVLAAHYIGWHHTLAGRWEVVSLGTAHLLLLALTLLAPRARLAAARRDGCFLTEWYPLIVMAGLYATIGLLNDSTEVGFDALAQRWELAVFGRQVAHDWIRTMPSPALSWVLHLCYLSFYPLIFVAPAGLWLTGRRAQARAAIYAIALAFFVCYIVFLLFPVEGPPYYWAWPDNAATAVWPARVVHALIGGGDARGSAFPSSHVAVSLVAAVAAWRGWRPLGAVLLVPAVGIVFAVVYSQIHYGVDALAGVALAVVLCGIGRRLTPRLTAAAEGKR
ncbi:MAG TPA: phosphatase PAP2 family protein [Gemmatimonadales bacterium]|nr:phosphatase PAP2 family protein [Gemmatimonadales bacterium]